MLVRPQPNEDNPLWKYFSHNERRIIYKWHHYFDIYNNHFSRFRGLAVKVLEIGIYQGGSLQMWKNYFGPDAKIYGVDIDPSCKELEEEQIEIIIGDQADRTFLRKLVSEIGPVDILIDDGGHRMIQQITTFEELYPHVNEAGVYLVEDLHTSYLDEYGGGYRKQGTFIEYAKEFIDGINAWHSLDPELTASDFTKSTTGIHFYDSVLVIEKYPNYAKPAVSMTGKIIKKEPVVEEPVEQVNDKDETIKDLMAQIQTLNTQIKAEEQVSQLHEAELGDIKNSTAWSIIQFLWKVRVFLAPHGSQREKIGRLVMRVFHQRKTDSKLSYPDKP